MKNSKKVSVKLLVLAAAAISPSLIAIQAEATHIKTVETLGVRKMKNVEKPSELFIYKSLESLA